MMDVITVVAGGVTHTVPNHALTVKEVAALLGVRESVVRDLGSKGKLDKLPPDQWPNGKCVTYTPESVARYLQTRRLVARWAR